MNSTPRQAAVLYPEFRRLDDEEQEAFENICEFMAERAAIFEFEAGMSRVQAEQEAERLALERFPPGERARAAIIREADRIAAFYGFPQWNAAGRLTEARIRRLHVSAACWLALCDYFNGLGGGSREA